VSISFYLSELALTAGGFFSPANGGNGGKSMSGASGVPVLAGILPIANNVGATPLSPKFSRVLHIRLD